MRGIGLIGCLLLLQACSLTGLQPEPAPAPMEVPPLPVTDITDPEDFGPAADETGPNPTQFSRENLELLLAAEFAGKQQDFPAMLQGYRQVALSTRDPEVLARAYGAAKVSGDQQAQTELITLWAEVAPDNVDVQQQAAIDLLRVGRFPEALARMERVLELEGPTSFDRLAVQARGLSSEQKAELLTLYEDILARYPDNLELQYGYAVLLELNGRGEEALRISRGLAAESKRDPAVISLHARLLKGIEGADAAMAYLASQEEVLLANEQLGQFYARALVEDNAFAAAQRVYLELMQRYPENRRFQLAYALVAMENEEFEQARSNLLALTEIEAHRAEAWYYLGRLYEMTGQNTEAIAAYGRVDDETLYLNAQGRASLLLTEDGQIDKARALLSEARDRNPTMAPRLFELEISLLQEAGFSDEAERLNDRALLAFPGDTSLLYARAMLRERKDDIVGMEQDLRAILALEPENAVALNALGYTLADRNLRLVEAEQLIRRAYALDPDNPAILDSMGWVLFRLDRPDDALPYLRQALAAFPDAEIAAHLAEVLWILGSRREALELLQQYHAEDPEHRVLSQTIERLQLDPSDWPVKEDAR